MIDPRDKVAVIGIGRLGSALVQALYKSHYNIVRLIDQNLSRAERVSKLVGAEICSEDIFDLKEVDIIFICVPDDAIDSIILKLKNYFEQKHSVKFVFHCSGALTSDVFDPLRTYGAACASFHPIQTFAGKVDDWKKLQNIYFGLEGDLLAIKKAANIIKHFNSHQIIIPKEFKNLYHLACTLASNYMVSLMVPVIAILKKLNISEQEILTMLNPLLSTTLSNLKESGIEEALTGPVSRGDVATIKKHIETLSNNLPFYESMYKLHGKILLDLKSVRDKISDEKYDDMMKLLNGKGLEYD